MQTDPAAQALIGDRVSDVFGEAVVRRGSASRKSTRQQKDMNLCSTLKWDAARA